MYFSNKKNIVFCFMALVLLFQSCKTYQESITLNEAALKSSETLYKVTLLTGEELIVEEIEMDNDIYFGTSLKDRKKERIIIEKSKVKFVQEINKKSSKFMNVVGFGVLIGSLILVAF